MALNKALALLKSLQNDENNHDGNDMTHHLLTIAIGL